MDWKVLLRRSHANLGILTAITLGVIGLSCFYIAHKPANKDSGHYAFGKALRSIHFGDFLPKNWRWVWIDSQGLALVALVGSGWFLHIRERKRRSTEAADPSSPRSSVTIVYASQSGTAEGVARSLSEEAEARGLRAFVCDLADYPLERLSEERYLLAVVSTFGKGVAPEAAQDFETRLAEFSGKLGHLEYAVLALGDVRYPKFCAFGRFLDERFEQLGAKRLAARLECDADHSPVSEEWKRGVLALLEARRRMPEPKPRPARKPKAAAEAGPKPETESSASTAEAAEASAAPLVSGRP